MPHYGRLSRSQSQPYTLTRCLSSSAAPPAFPTAARVCVWCGASETALNKPLLRCSSCGDALHCSRACQTADFSKGLHHIRCRQLRDFTSQSHPAAGDLVLRWEAWFDRSAFLIAAMAVAALGAPEVSDKKVLIIDLAVVGDVSQGDVRFRVDKACADAYPAAEGRIGVEKASHDNSKSVTVVVVTHCQGISQAFPLGISRKAFSGEPNLETVDHLVWLLNKSAR